MTTTLTLRLPEETKNQIEELSKVSNRKKSEILLSWITEKLDLEKWQIEETKKAILQADMENFASEQSVQEYSQKWKV